MFVLEKQSAVKPRDTIGEKEEETALIVVSWKNTQRFLPLAYRFPLCPKISKFSYLELITIYFCLFYLSKFNFTYFLHNSPNYSVFQDVPECSGMFNVPGSMFRVP